MVLGSTITRLEGLVADTNSKVTAEEIVEWLSSGWRYQLMNELEWTKE